MPTGFDAISKKKTNKLLLDLQIQLAHTNLLMKTLTKRSNQKSRNIM
jgi:hypothetical protein